MNVGIITWHNMQNFGSMLQAYALQKILRDRGNNVRIIDYRNFVENASLTRLFNSCKLMKQIKMLKTKGQWKYFLKFQNQYLKLTKVVLNKDELIKIGKKFDCYICGSDQIWAPNVFDETYFLNFVTADKLKFSYAPSAVIDNYTDVQKKVIKKELKTFNAISLREKKGTEIISRITNLPCEVVLDPTLLINSREWDEVSIEKHVNKHYLLMYMLSYNKEQLKIINKIAEDNDLQIINIGSKIEKYNCKHIIAGPREFLGYVKHATIICTDSYHGTLFAINYNKKFYTFERFNENDILCQNDRIHEILGKLELEDRIVDNEKYNKDNINYDLVNLKLTKYRENSLKFIVDNLRGDT